MSALVATYPPLGQVTILDSSSVTIHAVLEVPRELAAATPWQLALWHSNDDGGEWTEAEFAAAVTDDDRVTDLHLANESATRLYFTANVVVGSSLRFTVKFRQRDGQEWRWARSEQGSDDGVVVIKKKPTRDSDPEDLPDLIHDLNPALSWKSLTSQAPGTRLWSIEAAVDGTKDNESSYADVPLGIPWGRFLRWFALVRPWTPWLAPRQGKTELQLDKDALLCSFLSPQGKHMVFLGMSAVDDVITLFRSSDSNRLAFHIRSDNPKPTTGIALVAVGDDIESTIAAVVYHARDLVSATIMAAAEGSAETPAGGDVQAQWYETWYDGLGYCTWNSLGQQLTEEKILTALDALAENNLNISNLIIDDNWQDIDHRGDSQWQHGWNDFEAEPKAFPRGLKALVSDIRSKHQNIQHIAVWHALLGYWAGLAPNGPLAKRYKTVSAVRDDPAKDQLPVDGKMTLVAEEDIAAFYDDFYRFLSASGVDGVKTDAQYMLDTLVPADLRRTLTPAYLDAWARAALRHFPGRAISCMSQAPPVLFRAQLPDAAARRPPCVLRNSDDYFPGDRASHPWHVWANAHAALLTRHLPAAVPDWDMFQTAHGDGDDNGYAAFHAAARCVSGGPVYITDEPGRHDAALLAQVSGATPRGRTVVFRPAVAGRALDAYVGYGEPALLKVGAYHGRAGRGTAIVGLFNVVERPVAEVVPLARFPGVVAEQSYVVRAHGSGRVTPPLRVGAPASLLAVSLGGRVLLANLGLVGKMTGCAAVLRTEFEVRENGRLLVDATVKALGVLGIYISVLPELSIEDDFMVTIQGQPIPSHTVTVNKDDQHVLDVDIETAWREMKLESGWANEVEVKVYFALERK
ncbi:76a4190c-5657-4e05-95d5-21f92ca54688 [Thermothielavioides terrestris]|uniref:76a4190c-5657-4e05-95d5-21f92ca54688 n=1 Tax=Thermothielavioides terrestris TaxID=2587410 RepID=A0A446B761_9PEZI|nr:76a4190c-5657-4e05-95d5-21f92ca54688 [Thermothielavioides terrestris]